VTEGIAQNHSGAEKANAGQNPLNDSSNRVRVRSYASDFLAQHNQRHDGRAEAHERMGADSRGFAVKLAI
jgi:hypothetical protein